MHAQPVDDQGIPVSSGMPLLVRVCGIVGIIAIFVIAALVLTSAGANHVWPAENSTKIPI